MDTSLASWNDTPTRQTIESFVARVTDPGGPDFVPAPERVAVFDNDGTLWVEQPIPAQLHLILERLGAMVQADPSLRERQPWKAAVERDAAWLGGAFVKHYHGDDSDLQVLMGGALGAFDGVTIEAFEADSRTFVQERHHTTLGRPYGETAYLPMVELLDYLEANGFSTWIISGGGRDFVRAVSDELYGIPPERVVGSAVKLRYEGGRDTNTIVHTAAPEVLDDGPEKPIRLWDRIGRRPIIAGGNSNGDIEMLEFAGGSHPALRILIRHDDAEREFDYVAGAERSLELAAERDWTVVSVKDDWSTVFADPDA
jgi:phosphoserine phosphatase